ncbi:MAG: tRNA (adenosine(37)-N6)-threonylcarbamoyltransferase complex transferase subunit TsaD [Candidatus Borkfalkiaceae bacterium]|nr:tRNA (adenosine(37)-N6)-threonylcarbamoyltransferase complex transferase subunit TsaD [Clostridia bacterium]MDY6223548.1 tRNA (adenosine(37)-N6)-threonylcarbamoyltransferase complex transferase subunit TsaD [Christensenellaceae bacterium]
MSKELAHSAQKKQPVILGIESSCDETAAAVIFGRKILSDVISSSASVQALYGGVVPEIASRAHLDAIDKVVAAAISDAGISADKIDAVAVTYGAGLLGALLVGVSFAKAFAYALQKPLIGVNHIRGHLAAAYLADETLTPPFITLLASGGHTAILYAQSETEFTYLGGTKDDAAGEAFDKVARVLGLPYPGGPNIQKCAAEGRANIPLPQMFKGGGGYDFSYSGLKTAVINYCHTKQQKGETFAKADVAASFQKAAVDVLVKKTVAAAKEKRVNTVTAGGGVVANDYLRQTLAAECAKNGLRLVLPEKRYCTDNAAMIASEGLICYRHGIFADLTLNAKASIPLSFVAKEEIG